MSAASSGTFGVHGYQTGKLTGTYSGGGSTTLSLNPAVGLKAGEEIEVALTGPLTSTAGQGQEAPFIYRFRVETTGGAGAFNGVQTLSGQLNAISLSDFLDSAEAL